VAAQGDEDWSLSWKQHWQPDPVGERLLVLPAWLEGPAVIADRLAIRIDPVQRLRHLAVIPHHPPLPGGSGALGRAGAERGDRVRSRPVRVADLGCGSGILAGSPEALERSRCPRRRRELGSPRRLPGLCRGQRSPGLVATLANAHCNGVWPCGRRAWARSLASALAPQAGLMGPLQVAQGSVTGARRPAGGPTGLICLLCNILAPVIEALAPAFATALAPDGVGLLSGLLVSQVPGLSQALAAAGWRAELVAQESQWGLLGNLFGPRRCIRQADRSPAFDWASGNGGSDPREQPQEDVGRAVLQARILQEPVSPNSFHGFLQGHPR
jgi:ribosomal protein L11 methyltransferase